MERRGEPERRVDELLRVGLFALDRVVEDFGDAVLTTAELERRGDADFRVVVTDGAYSSSSMKASKALVDALRDMVCGGGIAFTRCGA